MFYMNKDSINLISCSLPRLSLATSTTVPCHILLPVVVDPVKTASTNLLQTVELDWLVTVLDLLPTQHPCWELLTLYLLTDNNGQCDNEQLLNHIKCSCLAVYIEHVVTIKLVELLCIWHIWENICIKMITQYNLLVLRTNKEGSKSNMVWTNLYLDN